MIIQTKSIFRTLTKYAVAVLLHISFFSQAQLQYSNWYFGNRAGLSFNTGAPLALTNGSLISGESCSAISDLNGNLLFYTKGDTIWNQSHQIMANGTGLFGHQSTTQGALILKQPNQTNLYYVFTLDQADYTALNGLRYSIVDMSLAAGQGSVIAKNSLVYAPSTEKMAATMHCNGTDVWIVTHERDNNNFKSYLLSAAGLSTTPVVSAVGATQIGSINSWIGQMKISVQGKRLGLAVKNLNSGSSTSGLFQVFDFDNSTGQVSNAITLSTVNGAYGCEFSPDGTKFYGTENFNLTLNQWDLCAGTPSAVSASQYSISIASVSLQPFGLQLAIDGKIYGARSTQTVLYVINDPNASGALCNATAFGPAMGGKNAFSSLPSMLTNKVKQTFTFVQDLACSTASFSPPAFANPTYSLCFQGASNYNLQWNFGEPSSGIANTSTLANAAHTYSAMGTYTVKLKWVNTICNSADSVMQTITLSNPSFNIQTSTVACNGVSAATLNVLPASGALSYTWLPSNQNTQVATGLSAGTHTVFTKLQAGTCVSSLTVSINPSANITLSTTVKPSCIASSASLAMIGGSGNYTYLWSPGASTSSTQSNLPAGTYTVQANDVTNQCSLIQTFSVSVLPSPSITVTGNFTVCVGASNSLQATGANTYSWSSGAQNSSAVYTPTANTVITVVGTNSTNLCASTKTLLIYYSKCVGLNAEDKNQSGIEVYPNPASTEVFVKIESTTGFTYELVDAVGKSMQKGLLTKSVNRIALKEMPNGIYFLKVYQQEQLVYSGKVVVEK